MTYVLVSLAALFLVGIPAIRRAVSIPARFEFLVLKETDLSNSQRSYSTALSAQLLELGYTPEIIFRVTNLTTPNLTVAYASIRDSGYCFASTLNGGGPSSAVGVSYIEFVNEFSDGSVITTRNSSVADVLKPLPQHQIRDYPQLKRPKELYTLHRARVGAIKAPAASRISRRDLLEHLNRKHAKYCQYQIQMGLLEPDSDGKLCATTRCALLGIANFLNPFADNFTVVRAAAAAAAGLALPLAAMISAANGWWPDMDPKLQPIVLAGVYIAAGSVLGWLFSSKAFVWSVVLGLIPAAVLGADLDQQSVYALIMAYVAHTVSGALARRKAPA